MYEKPSTSDKVFLMKKVLDMKMTNDKSVAKYLNDVNDGIRQLKSVGTTYAYEIVDLLLISCLSSC